ncbi:hypothetical protein DFH09DRAFT_1075418 [Mycena vulgaris]|nr:hypothetical protein DFH09DRAFT_1075418 [Mycena vulgaris]
MRAAEASAGRENTGGTFWGACMLKTRGADMKSGSREYKIRRPRALDLPRMKFIQLLGSANEAAGSIGRAKGEKERDKEMVIGRVGTRRADGIRRGADEKEKGE